MKKVMTLGKKSESQVLGVCSGLANYWDIDVSIVRILALVVAFTTIGFIPYLICWLALPKHPADIEPKEQ